MSVVVILVASGRILIRVSEPSQNRPNYIIRLDILAFCCLQALLTNLIAPLYLPQTVVFLCLQFIILASVSHAGIRNYALSRPLIRPLMAFYRRRLGRRVVENPYSVTC